MGANCGMVVKTLLTGEGRRRNMYALFSTQRIPLTADNPSTSPQLLPKRIVSREKKKVKEECEEKFQRCRFGNTSS